MSLGSGILFGALIGYGAYRVSNNPKDFIFIAGGCVIVICSVLQIWGSFFIHSKKLPPLMACISPFPPVVVCGLLTAAMGYRYFKSGKFMPAGLVASLG